MFVRKNSKKKNNQFIKSFNTLSDVTSELYPSLRICAKAHTHTSTVANRWQLVEDLNGSEFERHTYRRVA